MSFDFLRSGHIIAEWRYARLIFAFASSPTLLNRPQTIPLTRALGYM